MAWRALARQLAVALLIMVLLPLAGFCMIVAATAGPAGVAEGIASLVASPGGPDWIG
jgi:hypothetical protein